MIFRLHLLLVFIFSGFCFSGTDGTVRGSVLDVNGETLPGVQVYIEELGQGATTDIEGNYIILNVQVGSYDITARMIGFATHIEQDVNITMDQTVWLNIILQEEAIEGEVITVSGEKKLVEAGTTSKKITVNQEAIQALPIKDVSELYSLQSGVVQVEAGMAGAIPDHDEKGLEEVHVRGGRTGEIAYMIDGLYIRNPISGGKGSGTRLNLFAVEEFDWQPGGFNAEYGDAMSAVSNMHTASGKNKFRYKFKYETSAVGASVFNSEYDQKRGFDDFNLGFGGKLPFLSMIPFVSSAYYWVSGQHTEKDNYEVFLFDSLAYVEGEIDDNQDNLVTPWDTEVGFRGFGFDTTSDIYSKFSLNMFENKLRFNYSFWNVSNHRKGFDTMFLYWDEGNNEIFRDTYRHTIEVNHTLSKNTFYTFRWSNFTQDYFNGNRWVDTDGDGRPNWFEESNPAGDPTNNLGGIPISYSDPDNPNVYPFNQVGDEIHYINRDGLGPDQWTSGWYVGADPGNYNWEVAEPFTDVNQDGLYTPFIDIDGDGIKDPDEHWNDFFIHENYDDMNLNGKWDSFETFYDYNGNGVFDEYPEYDYNQDGNWDGPELVQKAIERDGSYWLTPEMYVDHELYFDENAYFYDIQNDPYYGYVQPKEFSIDDMYFWDWTEERTFGGTDSYYSTSRARTNEMRLDVTSQINDKWRSRVGVDWKIHKLNNYDIKNPWLDGSAVRQRFAEYWEDVGVDGISYLDVEGNQPDEGEGNGEWDCKRDPLTDELILDDESGEPICEPYSDFNGDEEWNDYVEPLEFASYWQNTFEVPWMVINAGLRIDGVNYKTKVWADQYGDYSAYKPWLFRDCGVDGWCPDDDQYPNLKTLYPSESLCNDTDLYSWDSVNSECIDPWEMDGIYQVEDRPDGSGDPIEEVTDDIGIPYAKVFFADAKWLWKVSPRLGFSHVITDRATFTFNYGLYYQTPIYENVYLNTNRQENPLETFEESEGQIGNATMTASRTQSYEFGFNVQVGNHWAYSIAGWVKDMDQLVTAKTYRTGIYEYQVAANGDYGTAKGIDFTLENRGLAVNTTLQYTYSVAEANGEYDAAAFGGQYVDAPSQQYLMTFDRTHDLTLSMYAFLPFGVTASMTNFYQSGIPYTPVIFSGNKPQDDELNKNSKRSPDWYSANMSLSKNVEISNLKMTLGLSIYNLFNNRNELSVYRITGNTTDPGDYYTDEIGESVSSAYYDQPWRNSSPREINFFIRMDFN